MGKLGNVGGRTQLASGRHRVPVVLIPGIMGSRLSEAKTHKPIWDPDSKTTTARNLLVGRMSFRNPLTVATRLGLSQDDTMRPAAETIDGFAGVSADFYGYALVRLQSELSKRLQGVSIYACGYDFRQSNVFSARRIGEKIQRIRDMHRRRVVVVAHSMGGLVARYYSNALGGKNNIQAMFLVGSPSLGGPESYLMVRHHAKRSEDEKNALLQELASTYPSVYELLPNPRLQFRKRGDNHPWLSFDSSLTGYDEHGSRVAPFKTQAETAHPYLDRHAGVLGYGPSFADTAGPLSAVGPGDPNEEGRRAVLVGGATRFIRGTTHPDGQIFIHPRTYMLCSSRLKTTVGCVAEGRIDQLTTGTRSVRRRQGDGTVPRLSGAPRREHMLWKNSDNEVEEVEKRHCRQYKVDGAHGNLLNETDVVDLIVKCGLSLPMPDEGHTATQAIAARRVSYGTWLLLAKIVFTFLAAIDICLIWRRFKPESEPAK